MTYKFNKYFGFRKYIQCFLWYGWKTFYTSSFPHDTSPVLKYIIEEIIVIDIQIQGYKRLQFSHFCVTHTRVFVRTQTHTRAFCFNEFPEDIVTDTILKVHWSDQFINLIRDANIYTCFQCPVLVSQSDSLSVYFDLFLISQT